MTRALQKGDRVRLKDPGVLQVSELVGLLHTIIIRPGTAADQPGLARVRWDNVSGWDFVLMDRLELAD